MEARLRSDLSSLRGERDEALGIAASLRRKVSLLDGDLQNTKQKLARVEQEKIKMERDNRAAMSLAKSVGTETSSDVEFYKRKVRWLHVCCHAFSCDTNPQTVIHVPPDVRASESTIGTAHSRGGAKGSDSRDAPSARTFHEPEPPCEHPSGGSK